MEENEKKPPTVEELMREHEKKEIDNINKRANDRQTFEQELRTEERFINYFKNYHPASVENFIKDYVVKKAMWWQFGEGIVRRNENEQLQWINTAANHLQYIQQKKLFDAQCLWRAEKETYPGVEICFDFEYWEKDVMNCPFIEPVDEDDIELYLQYLNQNNVDLDQHFMWSWQRYQDIKDAYASDQETGNFPEWYDFCNGRRGTGVYMTLPDIRGEKESVYCNLERTQHREEVKVQVAAAESQRDKRPFLRGTYDKNHCSFFVRTFEDKQTRQYYEAWEYDHRNSDDEERLRTTLKLLLSANEPVPVQANSDFKEALYDAADFLRKQKIIEHLPLAFEQYQLNLSMGISTSSEDAVNHRNSYQQLRDQWYNMIIKGRVLNGEPPDLNF